VSTVESTRARFGRSAAARGLSILSALAVMGLIVAAAIAPQGTAAANTVAASAPMAVPTQELDLLVAAQIAADERDSFGGEAKPAAPAVIVAPAAAGPSVKATAPKASAPSDPASAQGIGYRMMLARGWGDDQWGCLQSLWNKESHWNVYAGNPSSGAYGIPQAVPGSKMAAAGPNWQSDPATQIAWGLSYIAGRYGNPCSAWAHSQANNWY